MVTLASGIRSTRTQGCRALHYTKQLFSFKPRVDRETGRSAQTPPVRGIRISNRDTAWHCSSTNAAGEACDGTIDLSVLLNFRVHNSMPKPVLPGYLCGSPVRVWGKVLKSNACAVKLCEYGLCWGHCQHISLQNGHYFAISLDFALSSSIALQSSGAEYIAWTLFS